MRSKDEDKLEVTPALPTRKKDPLMLLKKEVRVPTVQLERPNKEDEDENEIPITRPRSVRMSPARSYPKGKTVETSSEKTKKTKEALPKKF